jgi:hypothetical protein
MRTAGHFYENSHLSTVDYFLGGVLSIFGRRGNEPILYRQMTHLPRLSTDTPPGGHYLFPLEQLPKELAGLLAVEGSKRCRHGGENGLFGRG